MRRGSPSSSWVLLTVALLGLGVRIVGLDAWGTFDTEVQKAWSVRAAQGLADIYGPSDRDLAAYASTHGGAWALVSGAARFPRTEFLWGEARYFVDYPPGSIVVLALEGKAYRLLRPEMPNKALFNTVINIGPLLASLLIAWLLWLSVPPGNGQRGIETVRAAGYWLNPAAIFAAPFLGYPDPIFSVFGVGAALALARGALPLAAALGVAATLIKPQGVLLAPVIFGLLARRGSAAAWWRSLAAGAATATVVLSPWWLSGHLFSALDGFRRPFGQGTLAPLGLNVWWAAGYVADRLAGDTSGLARIWTIDAFTQASGVDPRIVARIALVGASLVMFLWSYRRRLEGEGALALAVIVMVHTYALLSTSVHENHTFLAVALAPLLLFSVPWARTVLAATSAFLGLSLFFAAGLGRRVTHLRRIEDLRFQAGFDPTVVTALLHVALVAFLWLLLARVSVGRGGAER